MTQGRYTFRVRVYMEGGLSFDPDVKRHPLGDYVCRVGTGDSVSHHPVFLSVADSGGSEYTALAYLDEATVMQGHSFGFVENGAFVPSDISHFESYRVVA